MEYGSEMGLTPDQVYDMNLWEFNAFSEGYAKRRKNDYSDAIYSGYYAGIFSPFNKRRPNLSRMIKSLFSKAGKAVKPEVDVKEFQRREQAFNERLREKNAGNK